MKHMKKLTKILFLCSFGSFAITLILEFSPRYNQILFVLRHSTLYLGIAFLISAVVSIFYFIYKSYFNKRHINILFLNIITLAILSTSLIWVADTRLDYIVENEVPSYMNETLYDDYSNKIYKSILVGFEPVIEVIEKTEHSLILHIEENCDCQQNSYYLEEYYPDESFDPYIDSIVEILVDIEIVYFDDHTIDRYTIRETRNITYEPAGLSQYYSYVSRKQEIENEYNEDSLVVTRRDYYYGVMLNETEFNGFPEDIHHEFSID